MEATFAGGCFWCMLPPFSKLEGVKNVVAGYSGGKIKNPSYKEVSTGATGHLEAIQITYDATIVSFEKLLETFWLQINPTDDEGQFTDKGPQYKTAIFYHNQEQKLIAEKSIKQISKDFTKLIVTKLVKFESFYPAEEYHQNYHKKNPLSYALYKKASGRASFLKRTWCS